MRRTITTFLVTAGLLVGLVSTTSAAEGTQGGVPRDLLPDLKMARLYGLELVTTARGRTRLIFGTIGWNVGEGPLEARGRRVDPSDEAMQVKQRIRRSDGSWRTRSTAAVMFYSGDGHDHWHVRQFMLLNLYKRDAPGGDVYGLRKLGYCLLDATRMANPPAGAPDSPVYLGGSCGHADDVRVRTGLSVGYGDDYPPSYAHQWMDVTGLSPSLYRICSTVDALDDFVEERESNNQRWTDLRIDIAAGEIQVLDTAVGACGPTVP
ncbi:lysyl oxidase family protein [soil metagenome]